VAHGSTSACARRPTATATGSRSASLRTADRAGPAAPVSDLELLGLQAEATFDHRGRIAGRYGATIAATASGDRSALWIGAEVPEDLAAALILAFDGAPAAPDEPPPALERCRQLLWAGGRAVVATGGPSYVFSDAPLAATARMVRSDEVGPGAPILAALRAANPGNWEPLEWDELLDGRLGPWTMALDGDGDGAVVASICHTPGPLAPRAAECGVWTRPECRGRGHAAATAAAWAEVLRPSGRTLFYSTDADNRSSQRVASRLGLRPIGWTWRLAPPPDPDASSLHPLCSLRPPAR
jgi:GNAT superfamily N-acetyltransferase